MSAGHLFKGPPNSIPLYAFIMSPMLGEDKDVDVELNYFICTLGHAAELKSADDSGYQTVTEFIDFQAGRCPEKPAVGFPVPSHDGAWGFQLYSACELFGRLCQKLTCYSVRRFA